MATIRGNGISLQGPNQGHKERTAWARGGHERLTSVEHPGA